MEIIQPGEYLQATVTWRNNAAVPYSPRFGVDIKDSTSWQEGAEVQSPTAPAGGTATVIVRSVTMPDWEGSPVDLKIMVDGTQKHIEYDWAICLKQRFQWAGGGTYDMFYIPEWDIWAHSGRHNIRHRGRSPEVFWAGYGIVHCTVELVPDPVTGWPEVVVTGVHNVNDLAYGSDIWFGGFYGGVGGPDDLVWSPWYAMTARPDDPTAEYAAWPAGHDPHDWFAAVWVVQSESPIERRNRGEVPVTLNVLGTGSWDFAWTDAPVFHVE